MTTPLRPARLRCAYLADPLAVAPGRVRLSWELQGEGRDRRQQAYQVRVLAGRDAGAEAEPGAGAQAGPDEDAVAWDSGRVESADSADVGYAGRPLVPGGRYAWQVRVWDENDARSPWSEAAWFEVELDPQQGWRGSWIGLGPVRENVSPPEGQPDPVGKSMAPVPYLRRAFQLDQPAASVRAARLYVTALGLYEARLNGARVGDAFLTPGWTDYDRRVQYQAYDVTAQLRDGENVLGALLADGWYSGFVGFDAKRAGAHYGSSPELLAQLVIAFTGGTVQTVATDEEWRGRSGAIGHADLLMGERHDLTLEPSGWDAAGFDDRDWRPVRCQDQASRRIVADPGPPVRVTQEIAPVQVSRDPDGRYLADFGQNLPGWLTVRVRGPAGAQVRVRHGEALTAQGRLYTENLRTARQADEFVTPGGAAVFEPRFTLHGFRYAEISGYPGELGPGDLTARVVHSDIEAAGSFRCSQEWLNQLFRTIDWGQRGNFISVPTDCPQRDERLGWLGDAQIFARTACYNRDVAAFFAKWLDDVADAQLDSGAFTDIAPRLRGFARTGAPAWADAGVIVPWTVYLMYGDRSIVARHFAAMTAYMDSLERANPDYLRRHDLGAGYNDWLAPGADDTPRELLATAYWAHDAALMAEMAAAIGQAADAARYRALRDKIGAAFADTFVSADGRMTSGTQTAYVLGLHMGLIPAGLRTAAADQLAAAIERADGHLTTGFVGVGYLLPVLSSHGRDDLAYRLLGQRSRPSWRYMMDQGATTIWERWDGWTPEHGFTSPAMNSFNHYSLGSVGEWLYRFVLGIEPAAGVAGFGRLTVRPHPGGQLDWAEGAYHSARGPIRVRWERSGGEFGLDLELPPNSTASVRVPSADPARVRDADGRSPDSTAGFPGAAGVREAVFEVGSGAYRFTGPPV
ncbi:MAG: family 78 glycoside hydrolase catalytic domain [Streptosporangiaceae bacterium]